MLDEERTQHLVELDQLWQAKPYDDDGLEALVARYCTCQQASDEILIDLLAGDMEWRWLGAGEFSPGESHCPGEKGSIFVPAIDLPRTPFDSERLMPDGDSVSSMTTTRIPRQPCAYDYIALSGEAWSNREFQIALHLAEWQIRCRMPNAPHLSEYEIRFAESADWGAKLRYAMDEVANLVVEIRHIDIKYNEIKSNFNEGPMINLPTNFTLGRQVTGEPTAPSWSSEHNKLIVTPREDRSISRQQFEIERVSIDCIRITNTSRNAVRFSDTTLRPSESTNRQLPHELYLGEKRSGFRFLAKYV